MLTAQHKVKPIDSIVEGFTDQEVLIASLSGRLDDRIRQLGESIKIIKTHEHSIHSVEAANKLVAAAESKLRAATTVREELDRQIISTQEMAKEIIVEARATAKGIVDSEVDAKTAADVSAKLVVQDARAKADEILTEANTELNILTSKISINEATLQSTLRSLVNAEAEMKKVRTALADATRITNI